MVSTIQRLKAISGGKTSASPTSKAATSASSKPKASPRRAKPAPAPEPIDRGSLPELVVRPRTRIAQLMQEGNRINEQIKLLEAQLSPIREELLKELQTRNGRNLLFGQIAVDRKFRAKWTYSVKLQNEMLRIKNLQQVEQRTGAAHNNPLEHTAFRTIVAPRNQEQL